MIPHLMMFPSDSILVIHFHKCIRFMKDYCIQRVSLSTMNELINADNEPYAQNHHLGAYATHCYETISDYIPHESLDPEEISSVWKKMANPREGVGCECMEGERAELDNVTWKFKSSCPCAASNRACDEKCRCSVGTTNITTSCHCHNQLSDVSSLQLDRDLQMVDCWGIDCYSRTLIQLLLSHFNISLNTIEYFLQRCLLPIISLVPASYASDMRYVY